MVARRRATVQAQLSKSAQVDRIPQDSHRDLRRVESHGILRHNEVDHELPTPLIVPRGRKLCLAYALRLGIFNVRNQIHQRVECRVPQIEEPVLNVLHPGFQLFFRKMVAGLA